MTQWSSLEKDCLNCQKCGLCSTRRHVVFGAGNPQAPVLFVGEGPGEREDLEGIPFVGRAGQLLDKLLAAVDLDREKDLYITNMVKCRPPQNRDPKPEEQEACMEWLRQQVALMRPKVVVCLGRIAAMKLIKPDMKITREHGKIFKKGDLLMMATLHPAALLRNPSAKPGAFEDFLRLQRLLQEKSTGDLGQPPSPKRPFCGRVPTNPSLPLMPRRGTVSPAGSVGAICLPLADRTFSPKMRKGSKRIIGASS